MPYLLIALVLTLVVAALYGFFMLGALAITRSRPSKIRELSIAGFPCAGLARLVLGRANRYLLACQVGVLLTLVGAGFAIGESMRAGSLGRIVSWLAEALKTDEASYLVATGVVVVVALVALATGQLAKAVAFSVPERSLALISYPLVMIGRVFAPVTFVLDRFAGPILSALGIRVPVERELLGSAEHITEMVELGSASGKIEEGEREMIEGVFSIGDTVVREVMTPRKDIIAVSEDSTLSEVTEVFVREGISRVVVTGDSLDDVKGILMAKDLMPFVGKSGDGFHVKQLMRLPYFVSNSQKIDDLLQQLKQEGIHFAVVLDEHGGVDGVVTIEDLIEEIVGDIFDEYDVPSEEIGIRKTKNGDLLVDGSVIIEDLNDQYHLDIPTGEYDTIAGFVIHELGRIPGVGEFLDTEDFRVRVESVEQNRITGIRVTMKRKAGEIRALAQNSSEPTAPVGDSNTVVEPAPVSKVGNATSR